MAGYRRILFATDLTAAAAKAAGRAAALARGGDATLLLAHFIEFADAGAAEAPAGREAYARLGRMAADLGVARVERHVLGATGAAHQAILAFAGEQAVDLIVVGALGHPGQLGMTVDDVAAFARCDVLIVQGGEWEPGGALALGE